MDRWNPDSICAVSLKSTPPDNDLNCNYLATPTKLDGEDHVALVWRNVRVSCTLTGGCSYIIRDVSGALQPGSLVALMGPSGAGKSTLMAALAHRSAANTLVSGSILLNGQHVGPSMYDVSGFIYQDELFYASITVSEHLHLMAHLKLGRSLSAPDRNELVRELLRRTGLTKCAHTRVGEVGQGKTLSGGEKKRLAFASELLSRPKILFCDEPTTGLDSYSAGQLVAMMRDLTRGGTSVLCTIHQPSDELFHMFDSVMLLANGRVGYLGSPRGATSYFERLGLVCPGSSTTAEFLLKSLSNRSECRGMKSLKPEAICDRYLQRRGAEATKASVVHVSTRCTTDEANFLQSHRDPTLQYMKLAQRIVIALLVGLCFSNTIDLTQAGAQAVQGIIFLIVSENTFLPMYAMLAVFPESFPLFLRERKANLYGTMQFYVAQILAMLPFVLLESLSFILIVYYLAHLRPTLLGLLCTVGTSVLVMNISLACGCFFSTLFPSVPMAMSYLVPFDYILMITSGIFIKIRSMPVVLRWLPFVSWMMFATEAISIAQWDGIEHLNCTGVPRAACHHSGEDVLSQYSFAREHLRTDLGALVGQYFLFHALAVLCLMRRANRS
ncbi:scarlet protein [Culex quinquefasciatus]|uniref:Scarlet protein n=1 Tax=Culex quinquefasciatus TaxID=7176 RepID=B0WYU4_CULQU|nr:scarlet protein [Culex quinquefasciatus]|eukprot:XP_001862566.1 scarlet protein [Culex quinquefasciatus]